MATHLIDHDIVLRVIAPAPRGDQAARGDAIESASWQELSRSREVRLAGVTFTYLGSRTAQNSADAVIVPAAATVADSHYALWLARKRQIPVGLWGHIDNYVSRTHPLDQSVERRMLRAADAVFAYTSTGADKAATYGVDRGLITCLDNTVDLSGLENELQRLQGQTLESLQSGWRRGAGRLFGYIGGLDPDKRVAFLVAVLDELYQLQPDIKFLIGGRGSDEELLKPAEDRGQVIRFGYADDATKALILRSSEALFNPGRIGLVAVEAMAAGIPIVTCSEANHGPEVEYLSAGTSLLVGPSEPAAMAHHLEAMRPSNYAQQPPSLDTMVERFSKGILRMLS